MEVDEARQTDVVRVGFAEPERDFAKDVNIWAGCIVKARSINQMNRFIAILKRVYLRVLRVLLMASVGIPRAAKLEACEIPTAGDLDGVKDKIQ